MKRKIPQGMIPTMLIGCGLLLGIGLGRTPIYDLPGCGGHLQNDPTQVCYSPDAIPPKDIADDLPGVAAATEGYDCTEPEVWRAANPGGVPDRVVMRLGDGSIEGMDLDAAWALAEKGQAWTLSFCSKEKPDA